MKTFLSFLAPLFVSLQVLFAPAELAHAFVSSATASTAIGFAVAFLTAIGTDAAANPAAGIAGAVVSFVLLHLAAKLASTQAKVVAAASVPLVELKPGIDPVEHERMRQDLLRSFGGWSPGQNMTIQP